MEEIGTGSYGTAYLFNVDNTCYVVKLSKVLKGTNQPDVSEVHWREIAALTHLRSFPELSRHVPELFDYKLSKNLNYIHVLPPDLHRYLKKKNDELNKSAFTFVIRMSYMGTQISRNIVYNRAELCSMMLQLCYVTHTLNEAGFSHNDVHLGNVCVQRGVPTTIHKVRMQSTYSLIDFGMAASPVIVKPLGNTEVRRAKQRAASRYDIAYLYITVLFHWAGQKWDYLYASIVDSETHPILELGRESLPYLRDNPVAVEEGKILCSSSADCYERRTAAVIILVLLARAPATFAKVTGFRHLAKHVNLMAEGVQLIRNTEQHLNFWSSQL
jgi:hypothetical protein